MCMESPRWAAAGLRNPQITEKYPHKSRKNIPTNHGKIIYILRNLYKKLCKLVDYLYTCTHKIIRYRSDGL